MIQIKNNYCIHSPTSSDIILNIYYLSEKKCKIITRQFDVPKIRSLEIKIDNEIVTIDPSNEINEVFLEDTILLQQKEQQQQQKIPKKIIQTSETYNLTDSMKSLIDFNPEYEYVFFSDAQRRNFLKNAFSQKIVDAYDILVPGAFKADLFRYGYLFIHGGCYFDDKTIARKSLREIIQPDDELLLCSDVVDDSILNSIIMTCPKNFLFFRLLLSACDNILSYQTSRGMLYLTGPKLMHEIFKPLITESNLRFKHIVINNDFSSYKNFKIVDKNSTALLFSKTNQEALNKFCFDSNHYRQLWNRNEIFYKNKVSSCNLSIFVYPNPYVDTFKFGIDSDELTIDRADCHDPWHFYLRLKILNDNTSEYSLVDTGLRRTLQMSEVELPPNAFFSSRIPNNISIPTDSTIVLVSEKSLLEKYQKLDNEVVILCESSHITNHEIEKLICDYVILFTGPDAIYNCKEQNNRTRQLYVTEFLLREIPRNYSYVKVIHNEKDIESGLKIKSKNISMFMSNIKSLYKREEVNFQHFIENYCEVDIPKLYDEIINKNQNLILDLNEIITKSGEPLEGNVFYEHHSHDYSIHRDFQNKRLNLFYHARSALDILEIGFNAGHSALIYLIANSYSKVHFFDLGLHNYSRPCFEYLNSKFPGRISIVWGDSTVTIPKYPSRATFDFIHIDGGHTRFVAESDFNNCRSLSTPDSLLMIDDYNGDCLYTFCNQLIKYKKVKKHDLLFPNEYHILFSYL